LPARIPHFAPEEDVKQRQPEHALKGSCSF
jgi:hypothetical protein